MNMIKNLVCSLGFFHCTMHTLVEVAESVRHRESVFECSLSAVQNKYEE